jgi:two-component system nitrate/nitrite response regulator NarL
VESIQIMSAIRVLIVDDQPSFRRHLRQLLTHAGLMVVGEAGDMRAARELTQDLQPDLAVVDVNLPGENGVSGTPQLMTLAPNMRVIVVSAHDDGAQVLQKSVVEAGAEAFIPKDDLDLNVVKKWADLPSSERNGG